MPVTGTPKNEKIVCPGVVLKPVPVRVTTTPGLPLVGEMPVTCGNTSNVNRCGAGALVVLLIVAVTDTGPVVGDDGLIM